MNRLCGTALLWITAGGVVPCTISPALAGLGGVDPAFAQTGNGQTPGLNGDVLSVAIQSDGKVVVGGAFTLYYRTARNNIARLNADGSLDGTFDPGVGANDIVQAVALQADGRVVIAGRFTNVKGTNHIAVARLNPDGSLDATFNPSFVYPPVTLLDNIVDTLALQADGRILIGGSFEPASGPSPAYVLRLNPDGTRDPTFNPPAVADNFNFKPSVQSLALQADGRVVIGGQFTDVGAVTHSGIARLNADGSPDLTFDPGTGTTTGTKLNRSVLSLALQPDGKVLAGGDFTNIVSTTRYYVARLNGNGSLDTNFNPNIALAFGGVLSVRAEVDGKVLVGGQFSTIDGVSRPNIARLNGNGSVDTAFDPGTGAAVVGPNPFAGDMAIQPDGNVLIAGHFTSVNGIQRTYIARLLGDQGGTVEFASAGYNVDENGGNATIAVRRTGSTNGSVSVNYATSDGTATAGADYTNRIGAVLFGPGETNKSFTVPIVPDSLVEGNETVNLTLGNPIGGVILGNQKTATLTIIDNLGPARPVIQSISASGGSVTITWSAATGLNYRVQFKANLGVTTWSDVPGTVTAGGSTATKTDNTISGDERYYQIALLP